MEKFFHANYRPAIRDIKEIFAMLDCLDLHTVNQVDYDNTKPTADGLLSAAVEIWKHHNPWIQTQYDEDNPF